MSQVILPVHSLINNDVVFNWHSGMTDNGLAKTIKSHNIGHSKHNNFLIWIQMELMTHVLCIVGRGV